MSTLPKSAKWYKKLANGDWGWAHGLQEGGVWAASVGFSGWLISPILGAIIVAALMATMDHYWFQREINQSKAMGRTFYLPDLDPKFFKDSVSGFWTDDAKADVLFPRKMRKIYLILSIIYLAWLIKDMGFFGVMFR